MIIPKVFFLKKPHGLKALKKPGDELRGRRLQAMQTRAKAEDETDQSWKLHGIVKRSVAKRGWKGFPGHDELCL